MKKSIMLTLFIGAALGLMSFYAPSNSPLKKLKWERLGEKVVSIKGDRDTIVVTRKEGTFKALKLKVMKAPIHLLSVRVHYGNGTFDHFKINRRFAPGTESRALDLPGNKRIIQKIVLNYKTLPRGNGRALVSVWGRH